MILISFFDLSIAGRIDAVLPDFRESEMTDFQGVVRILESFGNSAITFQDPSIPLRLDLLCVTVSSSCPSEMKCIKDTLRLMHISSEEAPMKLFNKGGHSSKNFEIVESAGNIEVHNGLKSLLSGKLSFCKIWCLKGGPLNADEQKSLPCLPRIQKGVLDESTNFIAS